VKVALIYGGPSPEAEISRKSAESVERALKKLGHRVLKLELTKELPLKLAAESPDVAFLALHGSPGEDGTVQGLLEIMGIPYTGCGVTTSAVAIDKDLTKRLLKSHGIRVPAGITVFRGQEIPEPAELPCIVKPARVGSSVGLSLVKSQEEFERAVNEALTVDAKALIEEFIEGREITVGVLNGRPLPPVEILTPGELYDYEAKYSDSRTEYVVPAELGRKTQERLCRLAEKAYKVLECRGAVRVDFRLDKYNSPVLLEINTIPGLTERSLLPKAAKAAGMEFEELIAEMLPK